MLAVFDILNYFLNLLVGNAQRAPVSGCIAGNITLKFEPVIETNRNVSSYTWNKDVGPSRDPSFAKYEGQTNRFQTFMDEIEGRIFHSPENPTDLHLTNLRISDAAKYTLVVRYVRFTGDSPEFIVDLSVKGQSNNCSVKKNNTKIRNEENKCI